MTPHPDMPKGLKRWHTTRQKGLRKFILQNGVLAWGLPMFVVMTFIVERNPFAAGTLTVSAVIWAVGGACFGWAVWVLSEMQYHKFLARHPSDETIKPDAADDDPHHPG